MVEEPIYVAFVDESGCDGDSFGKGSSEFLILSAAVGIEAYVTDIDIRCDLVGHAAKKPDGWKPPKFDKATSGVRWGLCQHFSELHFYSTHVIIHKPSIREERLRRDRNRLYQYASKLLVERISWICEAIHKPNAPGRLCRIVFSQDKSRSYTDFREYVTRLSNNRDRYKTSIYWDHIHPELIEDTPFKKHTGLLLADYHASAMGFACERKSHGQYDERFARILGESILKSPQGGTLGYGYKFWPQEAEALYHKDERFRWMQRV